MQLADYLKRQGIGASEFAERIGVTSQAVRFYLTGQRTPRRNILEAIVAETDGRVKPNDFYEVAR